MSTNQGYSTRFLVMAVGFSVCLIISNILALRVWQIGRLPLQLSGADLVFPISYILNDCITEVYGYKRTKMVIWIAFAFSAITAVSCAAVCALPQPLDEGGQALAQSYNTLFTFVPRTTIASLLAFVCGSTFNSWVLSRMKIKSGGKRFWLRAIVSTMIGEAVDTCIFIPAAYLGIIHHSVVLSMMLTLWVVKIAYEIAVLPLTSRFVNYIKRREVVTPQSRTLLGSEDHSQNSV